MNQKRISMQMVLFSLIGGLIGFGAGEWMMHELSGKLPDWLLIGLYIGQFAFFVGLFCLLAEMISPRINGIGWRQRYVGFSWKMLVPATFVMLGTAGLLFQLLYGSDLQRSSGSDSIVMLLDTSGSMTQTDPDNQLFEAAADLIGRMDNDMRVAVITFNDQATVLQPMISLSNPADRQAVMQKLEDHEGPSGGTNIEAALTTALDLIRDPASKAGNSTVVLMSDGYSSVNTNQALSPFQQMKIPIHTVGMSTVSADGTNLLKQLAAETRGTYTDVVNAGQLSSAFGQIYDLNRQDRNLLGDRVGPDRDSLLYAAERVLMMTVIGTLLGLALGLIFDNKHVAKSFSIGGAVAGILAGLVLEAGFASTDLPGVLLRLLADLVLAAVLTLFAVTIPASASGQSDRGSFSRRRYSPTESLDAGSSGSKRFN
ncbi:VWA domain-containing protein [Brevibacillus ruminantium]|uniref:VWA domain-containing protein n=1 Tax=Brevibacillus ruminantium TaxID=2950604 RepID=A0ABY4WEG9_9BACL|nr:vWA domain-containing protein [Brevibacillus ruminantium]USG65570.1 VWA domain-containing protein [Brevibacillus ruminantium]